MCDGNDVFIRESALRDANFEEVFLHEAVARHLGIRQKVAQDRGDDQHIAAKLAEEFQLEKKLIELRRQLRDPEPVGADNPQMRIEIAGLEGRLERLREEIRELERKANAPQEETPS